MKKLLSEEDIRQLQIEILDEVHAFCTANSITYFLAGGTLIGAIRHNGYIPWDDDIDIMMYRDDYNRFINLFNKNNERYHVFSIENDSGYNYHFAKICDKYTYLDETNLKINDIDLGINIDLFPLDKLPPEANEENILKELHSLDKKMYGLSFKFSMLYKKPLKQKFLIILYRLSALFTSRNKLGLKQVAIARRFSDSKTNIYGPITCLIKKRFRRLTEE